MKNKKYYCPICGKHEFNGGPGTYEICPICKWEDDDIQADNPDLKGGANCLSLNEYKKMWSEVNEKEKQ